MTVFFVVSGIGQALAGFVVDRVGARRVLFGGMALLGIAALVLAGANHYAMLLAGSMLAGLGNSVFHPADYTLLNQRVSKARIAHAFSVHGISGNLGWAAAPVFLAGIAALCRLAHGAAGRGRDPVCHACCCCSSTATRCAPIRSRLKQHSGAAGQRASASCACRRCG